MLRIICISSGLCNAVIYDTGLHSWDWIHGTNLNGCVAIFSLCVWMATVAMEGA